MKPNHSVSCNITREYIAQEDIRCSAIEESRKVGVKQSSILRNIQDKLLYHIDNVNGPMPKKQKITILEQCYSPNTINNINFNHYGIKSACSRIAVKDRAPFPTLENLDTYVLPEDFLYKNIQNISEQYLLFKRQELYLDQTHAIMGFGRKESVRNLFLESVVMADSTFGLIKDPWKQVYIFGHFIPCPNLGNDRKFIAARFVHISHA